MDHDFKIKSDVDKILLECPYKADDNDFIDENMKELSDIQLKNDKDREILDYNSLYNEKPKPTQLFKSQKVIS